MQNFFCAYRMKNLTLQVKVQNAKDVYLFWLPKLKHKQHILTDIEVHDLSSVSRNSYLPCPETKLRGDRLVRKLF